MNLTFSLNWNIQFTYQINKPQSRSICNYIIEFKFYSLPICWTELILVTVGGTATTHWHNIHVLFIQLEAIFKIVATISVAAAFNAAAVVATRWQSSVATTWTKYGF